MRLERGGRARRLTCLIALGCLMGAATAAGVALLSAAPAPLSAAPASAAACSAEQANVEGGRTSYHYGVRGDVYVNSRATVNAYNYGFVRSLAMLLDNNNFVEIGWSAHIAGTTSPQVFAEWDNNGVADAVNYNIHPLYGNNYGFTIENYGHVRIFRFYFGSTLLGYSPTMIFNDAKPIGNSERKNWCQSLWAHFYNLNDYTPSRTWENWDNWAFCFNSSHLSPGNPFFMHKDSATQFHVYATGPDNMSCDS